MTYKYLKLVNSNKLAKISVEDYGLLKNHRWCFKKPHGYVFTSARQFNNELPERALHRIVLAKQLKPGFDVDHINGNPLDNRKCNLRLVPHYVNNHNRKKPAKGYSWDYCKKKWRATLSFKGKQLWLGYYETRQEAAKAYWAKKKELGLIPEGKK